MKQVRITLTGRIQGVGFRPFVYNLAQALNLNGCVYNIASKVIIELSYEKSIESFVEQLKSSLPSRARIDSIDIDDAIVFEKHQGFFIKESSIDTSKLIEVTPDLGLCKACKKELLDPNNRRFNYPFISCTQCGPRYSILEKLPFDREHTSLKKFSLCKTCEDEYHDPTNRRFHAQTISCFDCGPKLSLLKSPEIIYSTQIIERIVKQLENGDIVAMKGIGGYHLLCDATNEESVMTLRQRKNRPKKPFAVMVKDLEVAKSLVLLDDTAEKQLSGFEAPIVVAVKKDVARIAQNVAPDNKHLGLFLPYTPLHFLLLRAIDRPLIVTSANISDEPLATTTKEIKNYQMLWDSCVDHDREILNGCDDSVVQKVAGETTLVRMGRGLTPKVFTLPTKVTKKILAVGAHQKNSIAIAFDDKVILSPYIGDLDSLEALSYFETQVKSFSKLYDFTPEVIVCDKHQNYLSHQWAKTQGLPVHEVQHHHAHILGVMLSEGINEEVLGISFDGSGWGEDATLWGGEFLQSSQSGFKRVAHLKTMKLLGGVKAIKEPRRIALSLLFECFGKEVLTVQHPVIDAFTPSELENFWVLFDKDLNTPKSSSAGRLFDAIASLADLCQVQSYEGETGTILTHYYDASDTTPYPFIYEDGVINYLPMIKEIFYEISQARVISRFFYTMLAMIESVVKDYKLPLVFSGGVFQNTLLVELLKKRFPKAIFAKQIPSNDGGIALGQIAAVVNEYS